ncbi:MAG: bifunctional diaminohydroxyphosphoribosylaminopyrimidine deaminase/5-amino-6-(5-phosphoribosylamino)uracil reductase RibD [Herbiconiux sp.]|uniref:bifunctional diaminohydroxyphosphoribosylaminopyrimidine deaminase/5-amino-6-(5-phosphoribosylamino)uracil reductase RibD n=1 Tax=Herbiconiux sp. TaxID=1871186 RepID=UPI001205E0DE|nr:bifunctional diaminohydroxyphosphoribosylaminopyrimidine deaminase/5-amino-6-(5-phosphoribosylamino)uracil reductase RibD [Herbiconiux sp.]TAJ50153.1 MAG: bifunctional diaminohydroxyphosphoribosylaminopyrimidine deaminase/5-amino-6-(5-phosphoribosylamino)uracil reductase RibD [Herbiconiux sp.]
MNAVTTAVATTERAAMHRALELALNGPRHGVNPQVGCVILSADGEVLAEGWHAGAGTPHAEVVALSALADPSLAHGATAVVTLEPCNHQGRTGPCSEALISAGIARVVYAVADPGHRSSGGGERMRAAGLSVEQGLLGTEAEEAIRPWLTAVRLGRPFVTVKWASSLDGRAAAADGTSQWITGPSARDDVHRRRAEADVIVVGTGTMLADDPSLTARDADGGLRAHQPRPVVIGTREVPAGAQLHAHPSALRRIEGHDLGAALAELYDDEVRSVFVEGGPTLASAFLAAGLVDEVLVYLAPTLIGGPRTALTDLGVGTIGEQIALTLTSVTRLGDDLAIVARPTASAPTTPSPKE